MVSISLEHSLAAINHHERPFYHINVVYREVIRRAIYLSDYVVSQDEALFLTMPDLTTVAEERLMPLQQQALSYIDLAWVTRFLFGLDVSVHDCANLLRDIETTFSGGATGVELRLVRIKSKTFRKNENPGIDRIAERWIDAYFSGPKPIPADESVFESLQRIRYVSGSDDAKKQQECMICMDGFEEGLEICRLPCEHFYHGKCIKKWLEINHVCPLCRFSMAHRD